MTAAQQALADATLRLLTYGPMAEAITGLPIAELRRMAHPPGQLRTPVPATGLKHAAPWVDWPSQTMQTALCWPIRSSACVRLNRQPF